MAGTSRREAAVISWCFTLNNFTELEKEELLNNEAFKYVVVGKEVGDGGTPHLQGFCMATRRIRLSGVKRLQARAHWEHARSVDRAIEYCKKDGDWQERGECPRKRKLDDHVRAYREDPGRFKIEEPGLWTLYSKKLRDAWPEKPPWRHEVNSLWIYGLPGVGKSRAASEITRDPYRKMPNTRWWCGYDGERSVIVDEVAPDTVCFNDLLRWTDRYPVIVETKGGHEVLKAVEFVFTSNFSPRECYPNVTEIQLLVLLRRLDVCYMHRDGRVVWE
mmetsp:Transcript_7216/g.21999  ORF Transcript_7216/g.21999 Transcript_7216/m.21999 type:complete len:275 (+) Transcript_7216:133-957(+)